MKPQPAIHLHIEELVLRGFEPRDQHRIRGAVEQELARLLSQSEISRTSVKNISVDCVDCGSFRMTHPAQPAAVGAQIANAVHGGIQL